MDGLVDVMDSGTLRVGAYLLVAGVAWWWGVRERRRLRIESLEWWPTYWFTSAVLLATMGLARAGSVGDLLGEIGRDQAHQGGWYEARRAVQAAAVLAVAVVWAVGVVVAIWRVPPRRRRYLPHAVALSALVAFAGVRIVSLHQLDTLLYRREVAGIRVVAYVELVLLATTVLAAAVTARFSPIETRRAPAAVGPAGVPADVPRPGVHRPE